jgi:hypothetical protein
MADKGFTARGVALRMAAAVLLVLATANPGRWSYVGWVYSVFPRITPLQAVAGIVLVIGWVMYVTATMRSLGAWGVLLLAALFAAIVWLVSSWGWLHLDHGSAYAWVALLATGLILGIGMCWSSVRRILSGQADVDEVSHD